ncbi:hypothetical protein [Erythrobacter mangrovi]|uniref:Uncharacterized protein n=1 Tax=Erythrobacter mangrovi TaxID=2739433 RepID=A0A7D4CKS9_9SPHN|nr:hypothetical protein [Erythrobacter mangrovi]QKG70068.1 hypothetical protein HQR01_01035 [Erythrobacter mangrovi]
MAMPASAESFPPRDECGDIPGADAFRMALATAVASRDETKLLPLFSPDVFLDVVGSGGRKELRERLLDPDTHLWEELETLQQLGCGRTSKNFYLPWYSGERLGGDDEFTTYLAVGEKVPLRSGPSEAAPVIRYLNWEAVTMEWNMASELSFYQVYGGVFEESGFVDMSDTTFFAEVTAGSTRGYVDGSDLRAQLAYSLRVSQIDGEWQITSFYAGD